MDIKSQMNAFIKKCTPIFLKYENLVSNAAIILMVIGLAFMFGEFTGERACSKGITLW